MAVNIKLPDGSVREYADGSTIEDVAASISSGLRKNAVAGKLDGIVVDLSTTLHEGALVEIVTLDSPEGLEVMRHSTAHLMAQAVKRLFGNQEVRLGIGPVIEDGFYYDMDLEHPLNPEDLQKIEKEMERIVNENLPIVRKEVSREDAIKTFEEVGDPYKLELIRDLPEDSVITIYEQGEFFDLCRGPHVPSTSKIKVFKLMNVAGAYWRGDSKNKMLQRIYGTAFVKKHSWTSICTSLKKLANGITASWVKSSKCSHSPNWLDKACQSGCLTVRSCAVRWSVILWTWKKAWDTSMYTHRFWVTWNCTKHPDTGSTTRKICSRKWLWITRNSFSVQ